MNTSRQFNFYTCNVVVYERKLMDLYLFGVTLGKLLEEQFSKALRWYLALCLAAED